MQQEMSAKNIFHFWNMMKLWQRIILGFTSGIAVGLIFKQHAEVLKPIGTLFLNGIHMMIAPVVFTAIVCAIISMNDRQKMRRIGIKALLVYTLTMILAATIGLTVATFIAPGIGLPPIHVQNQLPVMQTIPSFADMIVNMIPANPVKAFTDGNILQILVFAIVIGLSINLAGEKAEPVANFFKSLSSVVFKLAQIVMSIAPFGIFALIAYTTGEFGIGILIPLFKLIGTIYLGFFLHFFIVYLGGVMIVARLSPLTFLKGIADALLFAFSSTSSLATLPTTIRCCNENLGIKKSVADFLLPLGTSLNLNGLSIYLGVAAVFAANMYGVHLNMMQYFTVVTTIVLTCMGAGGVPGSAIIVLSAVMSSIGLPLGAIPLIASVDRILDMASTTTNVAGDAFSALMVAKSENEWDKEVYLQAREDVAEAV